MPWTQPKKSFRENQLTPAGELSGSGHSMSKVTFKSESGETQVGYFKPCSEAEGYPPLLAKYSVAISQECRLALGSRSAEERLVFNEDGEITGTVSIAVPGFVPMLTAHPSTKIPSDESIRRLVCPTKQTLIDHNIGELLAMLWTMQQDDGHPNNISLFGIIDFDMFRYQYTSIIKGERAVCNTYFAPAADESACLRESELDSHLLEVRRTHWPTHLPKNVNVFKQFLNQAEFLKLGESETYKEQIYEALLKQLLSHQNSTLQERLYEYLGEEALGLDELEQDGQNPRKRQLTTLHPKRLFYRGVSQDTERLFVDHYMQLTSLEFKKLYTLVVSNTGFKRYLRTHPEAFTTIKRWFTYQNSQEVDKPFALSRLEQTYNKIWRDTLRQDVIIAVADLVAITKQIKGTINLERLPLKRFQVVDSPSTSPSGDNSPVLISLPTTSPTSKKANPKLLKVQAAINSLYEELNAKTERYFSDENCHHDIYSNADFVAECQELISETKPVIDNLKGQSALLLKMAKQKLVNLEHAIKAIDLNEHIKKRQQASSGQISSYRNSIPVREVQQPKKTMIDMEDHSSLSLAFVEWLKKQRRTRIDPIIVKIIRHYKITSPWDPRYYTRTGVADVEKWLKYKAESLSAVNLVADIFGRSSGWDDSSFKARVFQKLFPLMVDEYSVVPSIVEKYPVLATIKGAIRNVETPFEWGRNARMICSDLSSVLDAQTHVPSLT